MIIYRKSDIISSTSGKIMKLKNNFYSMGFIILFLNISLSQCKNQVTQKLEFPYVISKPDEKYVLQHNLSEVSGLSIISADEVALIDDEKGSVFYYNLKQSATMREVSFSKDGDYEDLKVTGDTAYVLRSDGTLYELKNLQKGGESIVTTKFNTGLSKENNTEGLAYDDKRGMLLIACKGKPAIKSSGEDYKDKKAIYGFNLETKQLSEKPIILIDEVAVRKMTYSIRKNAIDKIIHFYSKNRQSDFEPSGLAVHPINRDLYVLSSVGKLLVILDPQGKLKHVVKLPPQLFKQPEGIAFDLSGNMYISNEGRKGKGNILKFLYEKK